MLHLAPQAVAFRPQPVHSCTAHFKYHRVWFKPQQPPAPVVQHVLQPPCPLPPAPCLACSGQRSTTGRRWLACTSRCDVVTGLRGAALRPVDLAERNFHTSLLCKAGLTSLCAGCCLPCAACLLGTCMGVDAGQAWRCLNPFEGVLLVKAGTSVNMLCITC